MSSGVVVASTAPANWSPICSGSRTAMPSVPYSSCHGEAVEEIPSSNYASITIRHHDEASRRSPLRLRADRCCRCVHVVPESGRRHTRPGQGAANCKIKVIANTLQQGCCGLNVEPCTWAADREITARVAQRHAPLRTSRASGQPVAHSERTRPDHEYADADAGAARAR